MVCQILVLLSSAGLHVLPCVRILILVQRKFIGQSRTPSASSVGVVIVPVAEIP